MSNPTSNLNAAPWKLAEITLQDVRDANFQAAVLPFGATEPHNLHLPYGTDILEADWIANEICKGAWQRQAHVALLPTIPYGTETNMQRFPLAMNLQPSTLGLVVRDLVQSVEASGIRKLLLLNSHGGNELKPILRELYGQTGVHIFLCNWFQMVRDAASQIFDIPDDHAGEMETSLILAYRPELVARKENGQLQADDGRVAASRFEAVQKGWVGITRPWHLLTTNSGSGTPHAATAEKGQALMEVIRARLVPFLVDLASSPCDESFPFVNDQ
jgi:creatinine amidohydrolase